MKTESETTTIELQFNKQVLRKQLLTVRNNLTSQELEVCNAKIKKQLHQLLEIKTAKTIMAYLAFGKEISVDSLFLELWEEDKQICMPIIKERTNSIIEAVYLRDLTVLTVGEFGIRIPQQLQGCAPENIDVILVPGLAFAENGARLGLGKGYYDRFLPKAKQAVYIGIAAEYNLLKSLPVTANDVKMDYIVTENRIIKL